MNKLKERWGITSNFQLAIILIVFSITGSLSVYLTKPVLSVFGISKLTMPVFWYYFFKVLIIFPIYQVMLIVVGIIFGQRAFFWNFEKKMLMRFKLDRLITFVERTFGW